MYALTSEVIHATIEAEFTCDHPDPAQTRRVLKNGVATFPVQCRRCGATVRVVKKAELSSRERYEATPYDHDLPAEWSRRRSERYTELHEEKRRADLDAFHSRYDVYLQSPEWGRRRRLVMQRARGMCEGCGVHRATQVHHLHYQRVGRELLFDLVAICDQCHAVAHTDDDALSRWADDGGS